MIACQAQTIKNYFHTGRDESDSAKKRECHYLLLPQTVGYERLPLLSDTPLVLLNISATTLWYTSNQDLQSWINVDLQDMPSQADCFRSISCVRTKIQKRGGLFADTRLLDDLRIGILTLGYVMIGPVGLSARQPRL